jgi:FAD/FMN-containing dehydrogenase
MEISRQQLAHDQNLEVLSAKLRSLATLGEPVVIDKGGLRHFVPLPRDPRFRGPTLDVSRFRQLLRLDPDAARAEAEPGLSFGELCRATLAHGLLPTTVPELEGISVGGAVAGCSVESMSFKHGGFHDGCLEYELVTGVGDVVRCSPTREPEIFHMLHGSYGTLAILTKLAFRLIPAKPLVRMEYRRLATVERFHAEMLQEIERGDADFIDGIVHGPASFVLCLGRFVDSAPYVSDYRWLHVYYKSTLARREDYLSTLDYCFRYDAECHWLSRTAPPLEWLPVRMLLGKMFLGSGNLIRWSKVLEPVLGRQRRPPVVCDVFIPSRRFEDFYSWYAARFRFWPLWVVPYRVRMPYPWIAPAQWERMGGELFIDCAIYGRPNSDAALDYSELLEEKTFELGGLKTLISRNHYSEERFWQIYDRERYEAAKRRLDPQGILPHLSSLRRVG